MNYIRRQSFRAPLHLSKPHEDEGALVVNMVTPTAGVFDDDEIDIRVDVEERARLVLTAPSSSRVYRSRDGNHATVLQTFRVASGGSMEFYPEPFIPHAGARYHQKNNLHVASDASLLFFEWLSPGRVASGESFQYEQLRWDTNIWQNERLLVRECYTLSPRDSSLSSMRMTYENAHYLACFALGEFATSFPQEEIEALGQDNESIYLGCGRLSEGNGWTIKALCADSLTTRRTMARLRELIYRASPDGGKCPHLGRF
ncbi:MAG TPA: urease accessory protein UreD [Candidatus Methylacidiphilales bacterium]|nr:urease accessory protein UreD [Candidatus Methylacidiphilales bacterium]